MVRVTCRDCGRTGDEAPDDPAPSLCPACYEKRLARITPLLKAKISQVGDDGDITPVIILLAQALEDIGGETRQHARQHADMLGRLAVLQSQL